LVGNAVSSVVPGGAAMGGPLQYTFMVRGGEDPGQIASGLAATSLLSTTTLFGLSALSIPLMLHVGGIDPRLERAAWLGSGVFVLLLLVGITAFTTDGLLRFAGGVAQWVLNHLHPRRPPVGDLADRWLQQRDRVRRALGSHWAWALVAVVAKWAFDYFALLAAVAATGVAVQSVPLLLAYVAASVLALVPITPGGLGFVEAGLAVTLVWAGLPSGNATLATLAYRLVSYWLPLVAGIVAAVAYRARVGSLRPAAS
ncbi:MAG TPA: flippase-like domain-containing protein, partial [Acidimicrobiia bacterium]|nr:flippase-like domain-containing protein [Acidimicrobiia bacterium]